MIPPKANAEFVCAMETVLDVYQRPYDPENPVVCMDETSKQLVAETRQPLPPLPAVTKRRTLSMNSTAEPALGSGPGQAAAGKMLTRFVSLCAHWKATTPSALAKSVSSLPRPTLRPGRNLVPRWRTRTAPASTRWPP